MKYIIKITKDIENQVNTMTVDELLDIITCPNYRINDKTFYNTYCAFIHPAKKEDMIKIISKIKSLTHPVMIASDMEAGPGTAIEGATVFSSMRGACETGEPKLVYKMGKVAAYESREIGLNWTFAPCVDILGNHFSPMTSLRSAGEDKDVVIQYTNEYYHGLEDYHMTATLKHFPGDGYTMFDQHLTTAINPLSKDEWDKTYRKVYEHFINEGVKSIMPGHIALPSYDEIDKATGIYPPATLSYNLLTNLLKNDLKFDGLIISDATEMSGFCGYINYYDACARFLMSGGDCLLFVHPDDEFHKKMKESIDKGNLTLEVLKDRAKRVIGFAIENASYQEILSFDKEENEEVSKAITKKSVKIFKSVPNLLPIKENNLKIAHVIIATQMNNTIGEAFTKELSKHGMVHELVDPGCQKLKEIVKNKTYDLIVCTTGCTAWYGTNQIILSGVIARNMMNGWMKYDTPVVFVDFGNPYFHEEYVALTDNLIYTYGFTKYTCETICEKLFIK